ncbi:MAG: MBL fold metallo-hydrolase [Armatimonadota bacterium]
MRIVFLGTSHGNHTYERYNSSTLLQAGGSDYLIDCGEPVAGTLVRRQIGFERLQALFVTHMHADHVGGLPELVNMSRKMAPPGQLNCYLPEEGVAATEAYLSAIYLGPNANPQRAPIHPVRPGRIYEDANLRVTAHVSAHLTGSFDTVRPGPEPNGGQAFSYVVETEGKRIAFSGDICGALKGKAMDHLAEEHLDLLVMEMTHFQPQDILPVIGRRPVKQLALYHIHDPWHGAGEQNLRALCDEHLLFPWMIAHDGDVLEL